MEIDKTLTLPAPPDRVWALLLDPQAMAQCVPGMQSVQVVTPDEYTAEMVTKVSFITARMKLRTRIVERDEPRYLKAEGTGEDSGVASSLKQTTEMHLEALPDGGSNLRLKVKVDVVGRLATFGLSALKTKADRIWDEFGQNLIKHLQGQQAEALAIAAATPDKVAQSASTVSVVAAPAPTPSPSTPPQTAHLPQVSQPSAVPVGQTLTHRSWWQRLLGPDPNVIVVDWHGPDGSRLQIQWPASQADACLAWLKQFKST
jgi:uncharacterized protein